MSRIRGRGNGLPKRTPLGGEGRVTGDDKTAAKGKMKIPAILIIEDDRIMGKTLEDILKLGGFAPSLATNGGEGLSKLMENRFDVVLLDLGLPDIPGLQLITKIKSDHPFTEAIVLTGNSSLDAAIECMKEGACDYLLKPVDCDKLFDSINRAVAAIGRYGRFS